MLTEADFIQLVGPYVYSIRKSDVGISYSPQCIKMTWTVEPGHWAGTSRNGMAEILLHAPDEVADPIASAIVQGQKQVNIPIQDLSESKHPGERNLPNPPEVNAEGRKKKYASALILLS